ncbi:Oxoglutarate and iron-dependent oxygenase degradation C-term-domain-containing protein [Halteromyces radiatus]|uniref:Oxoglutarate and iron-dependent oxygenase degradation C-term-domain-containing protein n=1 Tax=Halteromyces radiatus TaxID=101107 RepID=UPI00221E3F13|nr:Oxoglutarate and iron-dependent oxygenase degradation C-term-domain-containing protein [Halteromyces radiatus]KAI8085985.1 Oxoglutarate and iron-dependent oxygenase degradation C-term-domain-containing protein [Halteromyces radiatus]
MCLTNLHSSNDVLEHKSKRQKTTKDIPTSDIFYAGLFETTSIEKIRQAVNASKPYKHCKIDHLVNDTLLRKVRQEILDNIQFTRKETDIYKVNQTESLAHLFQLRNGIYSQTFRDFVSQVTGCGPLSGKKMDMSVNIYNQGCHLLNHDDVIGDRRVSFILYMPDPDEEWYPSDGGALELYPVVQEGTSANTPTVSLTPKWNQFAMFTVLPGYSFHSVEEVVSKGKTRLSIQGWFHFPQQDESGYDPVNIVSHGKSSLAQLAESNILDPFTTINNEQYTVDQLDENDRISLSTWLNPIYLDMNTLQGLSDQFVETSSLHLEDILEPSYYDKLKMAAHQADQQDGYLESKMPKHDSDKQEDDQDMTSILFSQLQDHLESIAFRHWLLLLSKLALKSYRSMVRRFRPGLDYTLATIPMEQSGLLDVTFSLVSQQDASWKTCDVGGYLCYMACDDNDDASIYRSTDDDGVLFTLPCGGNELSIVLRDEGVMRFIKYVSANAVGSRWDISLEFETEDAEDTEIVG